APHIHINTLSHTTLFRSSLQSAPTAPIKKKPWHNHSPMRRKSISTRNISVLILDSTCNQRTINPWQAMTNSRQIWQREDSPSLRSEEHTSELQSRFELVC